MLLAYVTLAALLWQTPANSSNTVSVKDNEIWLQTASGERQLTHDGVPKRLPTLSPSGDSLLYVVDHPVPLNQPEEEIVVLDLNGKILWRITPKDAVGFDHLNWIDSQRIGATSCGHFQCMYWVLDPHSGKTLQEMTGRDFIWSHNRQWLATLNPSYSCEGVREGDWCPEHDAVSFNGGDSPYPPERAAAQFDDSHSHNIGIDTGPSFAWSPDDKWVAFTDLIGPEGDWYVVILSPNGKVQRDTVPIDPIDPDFHYTLEWLDNTHLDLDAGTRVFHFAIDKSVFSEMCAAKH